MRLLASCLILNATFPARLLAQAPAAAPALPPQAPAAAPAQQAPAQLYNAEQLDALLASIALYPDDLLTQVLMASTFPLEVVDAARWVEKPEHKSLSGDALTTALEKQSWDASVKSL